MICNVLFRLLNRLFGIAGLSRIVVVIIGCATILVDIFSLKGTGMVGRSSKTYLDEFFEVIG